MLRKALENLSAYLERLGIRINQLERLHESDDQFGVMSAWRSELSLNENKERQTKLTEEIGLYGLTYQSAAGVWEESKVLDFENSFLIFDIDFDTIWMLSEMFDQTAFIFKPAYGPVALYNIKSNTVQPLESMKVTPNQPRMREKQELLDKGEVEKIEPHTMIRDTEINYNFSDPVPFSGEPLVY